MSAPLLALFVVAYGAIGAVLAGLFDRHVYPEDRCGPFIVALWPALAVYWVVVVIAAPFAWLYRRVRGAP